MVDAALCYDALGFDVVRLRFGTKALHPVGSAGRALADHVLRGPEEITAAFSGEDRFSGIGLVQGRARRGQVTAVVDLDRKSGQRPRAELCKRLADLGLSLPVAPPTVRTPTGEHEYYIGRALPVCQNYLPGVDVQGAGSYVVAPPTHVHPRLYDPPGTLHGNGWHDARPWPGYRWVRLGAPRWSDDAPAVEDGDTGVRFSSFVGTAAPPLLAEDVWWPTGRELLASLSAAVLPEAFAADVRATPSRGKRSGAASGGVPVEEWRRTGIPRDVGTTQRQQLFRVAASCAGRGLHPERDTFPILRDIADRTPLLRPNEPWTDAQLRAMARNAVENKPNRDRRDRQRDRELTDMIDFRVTS
jgi:hypothetical protein